MIPRDLDTVRAVLSVPFDGYARQPRWTWAPDHERIVASVALLGAMVLSGVLLGSPRHAIAGRR